MTTEADKPHAFANRKEVRQEIAEMPTEAEVKPKTLTKKLCEVMAAVGYLQKTGTNSKQGYKYAREADVVAALRPELAKRHIFIFPNVISVQRNKVERLDFDKALKFSWATDILVEWTIEDGESGETRKCIIPGCSESPGDKGVYVAMTGSEKYLLMKSFLLPTGDDPESDENEEKGSKEAAQAVAKGKIAALKGKTSPASPNAQQTPPDTLFYTYPERHNGHYAEFVNLKEFGSGLNEVAQEGLRLTIKKYAKSTNGVVLISADKMTSLIDELSDCKVPLKELGAA